MEDHKEVDTNNFTYSGTRFMTLIEDCQFPCRLSRYSRGPLVVEP